MLAVGTAATEPWCQVAFSAVDHHPQFLKVQGWFLKAWPQLVQETWLPMYRRLHDLPEPDHDVRLSDGRLIYLARLLEEALWWAIDADAEPDRLDRVHDAALALTKLDAAIHQAAATLEDCLRERSALMDKGLVSSDWKLLVGPKDVSHFNLWEMLGAAASQPEFLEWATVCKESRRRFLVEASTQRRRSPDLADLVGMLARSEPSAPKARHFEDAVLLSKKQGRQPDPWANLRGVFFAAILEAWGRVDALQLFGDGAAEGGSVRDEVHLRAAVLEAWGRGKSDWGAIRKVLRAGVPCGQAVGTLLTVACGRADLGEAPSAFSARAVSDAAAKFNPVLTEPNARLSMPI